MPHPEELPNLYTRRKVVAAPRRERRHGARRIAKAFKSIVVVFAALYFLIDAIFFSLITPLGTWLSKRPIFQWIGRWIRSLGPYPTLALFAVPLIVLELVKPVGLYLIASGNVIHGTVLLGVGEIAKITIVERIFHAGRDKLMTIPVRMLIQACDVSPRLPSDARSLASDVEGSPGDQRSGKAVLGIRQKLAQVPKASGLEKGDEAATQRRAHGVSA